MGREKERENYFFLPSSLRSWLVVCLLDDDDGPTYRKGGERGEEDGGYEGEKNMVSSTNIFINKKKKKIHEYSEQDNDDDDDDDKKFFRKIHISHFIQFISSRYCLCLPFFLHCLHQLLASCVCNNLQPFIFPFYPLPHTFDTYVLFIKVVFFGD